MNEKSGLVGFAGSFLISALQHCMVECRAMAKGPAEGKNRIMPAMT